MVNGKVAVQYSVIQPVRSQTKYNKKVESIFHALFRRTLKNVVKTCKSGNTLQSGLEHDAT